jgi:DnaJ-class molecular chaperone
VTDTEEKKQMEVKFKEVKEAYESLSDAIKRNTYDEYGFNEPQKNSMDDIMDQWRRAHANGGSHFRQFHMVQEIPVTVSLKEAFNGFEVDLNGKKHKIQPGTPFGYKTSIEVDTHLTILVSTIISDPRFKIIDPQRAGYTARMIDGINCVVLETSPIETTVEVDALDLMLGAWVKVTDFLGAEMDVRIPAGFTPGQKLKVKGKGYVNWFHHLKRADTNRGDLFVNVTPVFKKPAELDRAKIEALLAMIPKENAK